MVEIFFSCLSQQTKDKRQEYNNLKKWRFLNGTPTTNVPVHAWKHIHTYNRASLSLFDSVHLHRNIHSCSLSKSEEEKKKHRDKVRRGMRNILLQLRCLDVISSSWLNLNLIQWKSCHIWNLLHVTASHTRLKMDFAVSKRNFDLPKFRFFSAFLSHSLMTSLSHCDFIFGKNKVFIDAISHLKMNQMLSVLACWWRMAALLNDS